MPKNIVFPDADPYWSFERDCVVFPALVDGKTIKCSITMEALVKHFNTPLFPDEEEFLRAYNTHKETVHAMARKKINEGEFEADGEVVIRTTDTTEYRVIYPPSADPELRARLQKASLFLAGIAGEGIDTVIQTWQATKTASGWIFPLNLTDEQTKTRVSVWITDDDLKDDRKLRARLSNTWGELLREKSHKLLRELQGTASGDS